MSNNENSGNNGGSEYGGNADVGASIDILLVIKSLRIRMSCEEVLEFIRKIRNGSTIISEAENILRTEKGFIEADANNLVKQIIDYDKYHRDLGQAEDTWNLNNEEPGPPGNEGGGRRSRKGKKQRRRTRRHHN